MSETEASASDAARSDVLTAIRNTAKLGTSLLLSWGVAVAVRFFLPRFLGPASFGVYNFADAFTATAFILVSLGVETYIQKEIPTRLEHASEIFGGAMLLRVAVSVALMAVLQGLLLLKHANVELRILVFLFCLGQFVQSLNDTLSALLQAVGVVGRLSVVNVLAKVIWGAGIVAGLTLGHGLNSIAMALLASELVKAVALFRVVRRELRLTLRFDLAPAVAALLASLPYFVNQVAHTAYSKVDVTMLAFLTTDTEVGWYGGAFNLAGLALLITPLIMWVLLPLTSRAASRSQEELEEVMRRSLQLILTVAVPVSLALCLGARLWIHIALGRDYDPSTLSLEILAPMFILTYAAMVAAVCLIRLERAWLVTCISLGGFVVNPLLNLLFIPRTWAFFGPGGAGVGAAGAFICTEFLVTTTLLTCLGRRAFDRASAVAIAKTLAAALLTALLDMRLRRQIGDARILIDGVVYFVLVIGTGALRPREMLAVAREAMRQRSQRPQETA